MSHNGERDERANAEVEAALINAQSLTASVYAKMRELLARWTKPCLGPCTHAHCPLLVEIAAVLDECRTEAHNTIRARGSRPSEAQVAKARRPGDVCRRCAQGHPVYRFQHRPWNDHPPVGPLCWSVCDASDLFVAPPPPTAPLSRSDAQFEPTRSKCPCDDPGCPGICSNCGDNWSAHDVNGCTVLPCRCRVTSHYPLPDQFRSIEKCPTCSSKEKPIRRQMPVYSMGRTTACVDSWHVDLDRRR